jgi:hypothetical protein
MFTWCDHETRARALYLYFYIFFHNGQQHGLVVFFYEYNYNISHFLQPCSHASWYFIKFYCNLQILIRLADSRLADANNCGIKLCVPCPNLESSNEKTEPTPTPLVFPLIINQPPLCSFYGYRCWRVLIPVSYFAHKCNCSQFLLIMLDLWSKCCSPIAAVGKRLKLYRFDSSSTVASHFTTHSRQTFCFENVFMTNADCPAKSVDASVQILSIYEQITND